MLQCRSACHRYDWRSKLDAIFIKGFLDHHQRTAANAELLSGPGLKLQLLNDPVNSELLDTLQLERFDGEGLEFRIFRQFKSNFLEVPGAPVSGRPACFLYAYCPARFFMASAI